MQRVGAWVTKTVGVILKALRGHSIGSRFMRDRMNYI